MLSEPRLQANHHRHYRSAFAISADKIGGSAQLALPVNADIWRELRPNLIAQPSTKLDPFNAGANADCPSSEHLAQFAA